MKRLLLIMQIATIFIGSIVGAGVCSGRELNQFFSTYGSKSFWGLIICAVLYIIIGKMIVEISVQYEVSSYNQFVDLVCPKIVAKFLNTILTLFLLSSTAIILAGSSAIIYQYFGIDRWIGFSIMVVCSTLFLMRNTEGLFEVNGIVVPSLIIVMSSIFFYYICHYPMQLSKAYMNFIPPQKQGIIVSTIVYVSFNVLTIIGVIVPLANDLKKPKDIIYGIAIGSVILMIISGYITFLMLVNPVYPFAYEVPLLALATQAGKLLQIAILAVMWLEMFSSQVSNVYSLSRFMETKFPVSYKASIFIVIAIAAPFSGIGFAKLVEVLYPLYGVLSLVFLLFCSIFYIGMKKKNTPS